MTFARRIYTKEFRINAAKLVVDEHRPATSVAEELNVSPKTLHSWVKQYREGSLQPRRTSTIQYHLSRQKPLVCVQNSRKLVLRFCY